jgi:hypothetical protein
MKLFGATQLLLYLLTVMTTHTSCQNSENTHDVDNANILHQLPDWLEPLQARLLHEMGKLREDFRREINDTLQHIQFELNLFKTAQESTRVIIREALQQIRSQNTTYVSKSQLRHEMQAVMEDFGQQIKSEILQSQLSTNVSIRSVVSQLDTVENMSRTSTAEILKIVPLVESQARELHQQTTGW